MTISVADSAHGSGTGSCIMNSACAVGEVLVVYSVNGSGTPFGTLTDNVNTGGYTNPASLQFIYAGRGTGNIFGYKVCNAVGTPTIANSIGAGVSLSAMRLTGFLHTPTLEAISPWLTGNGTAVSNSATTLQPNEMLLSFGYTDNNNYIGSDQSAGWTQQDGGIGALTSSFSNLVASAGAVTFSDTLAGISDYLNILVGFYDLSAATSSFEPGAGILLPGGIEIFPCL